MTTLTMTVGRANLLTANGREHRMRVASATKTLRQTASLVAQAARATAFGRAHVTVWVSWPDRRRRDVLNLAPTIKACIDGMTDAGLWVDDDDQHLVGPDFRVTRELSGMPGVVRLRFEIEEAS